jgi:hypothetical protein
MLGRAVQECGLHERDENFWWCSDDVLLMALAMPGVADALGLVCTGDEQRRQRGASLAGGVARRELYKLAYLGVADDDVTEKITSIYTKYRDASTRLALEGDLAAKVGLTEGDVLVHIPDPDMLTKQPKVRLLLEDGTVTDLARWDRRHSGRVDALARAHRRLWRVAVYVHPRALWMDDTIGLLVGAAQTEFGLRTRFARNPQLDTYFASLFDQYADKRGWPSELRSEAVAHAPLIAAATHDETHMSGSLDANVAVLEIAVQQARETRPEIDSAQ